jgi:hypothetical protein
MEVDENDLCFFCLEKALKKKGVNTTGAGSISELKKRMGP